MHEAVLGMLDSDSKNDQVNLTAELDSCTLKEEDLEACVSRLVRCVLQSNEYEA